MNHCFATAECGFQGYFAERVQLGQIAAIYCRVSTSDQDCERQETELVAFAAKAGYVVPERKSRFLKNISIKTM